MGFMSNTRGQVEKEMFVENVLLTVMRDIGPSESKCRLLNEIWDCLQEHLTESFELSWSLKGISHRFVKKIARARLASMLHRVASKEKCLWQ